MNRHWLMPYFAVWENLPNRVIWFESGKRWANALVGGNALDTIGVIPTLMGLNPLFGLALKAVLEFHKSKLRRHLGPNGIWVAVQVPVGGPPIARVYAKKRNKSNMNTKEVISHPPDPWEPPTWNVF